MPIWLLDLVYRGVGVPFMHAATILMSLWNPKARKRAQGAREAFRLIKGLRNPSGLRIWLHAASMGEFEQLVPVIQELKSRQDQTQIVVTIFSPSGIDHAKNSPQVDLAVLLPWDYPRGMKRFVEALQPDVLVIDRYDLWRNLVLAASSACPIVVANATAPSVIKNTTMRAWLSDTYSRTSFIHAVSNRDHDDLNAFCPTVPISITPDTRVDRVTDQYPVSNNVEQQKIDSTKTIVLGSTWPQDEDLWRDAMERGLPVRLIIVPHEPTEENVERLCSTFNAHRWSKARPAHQENIVVDSMGLLLQIYSVADAAFVGGGFGAGVHSVTEPAGRGIPVSTGPGIERSRDAIALKVSKGLTVLSSANEAVEWVESTVLNDNNRIETGRLNSEYITANSGGARQIVDTILGFISE